MFQYFLEICDFSYNTYSVIINLEDLKKILSLKLFQDLPGVQKLYSSYNISQ